MVRLDPILSDPDEDRTHNKIGAAMLGAMIGSGLGLLIAIPIWGITSWATWGCDATGALLIGVLGFWKGESFTHFIAEWLRSVYRHGPIDPID